MPSEGCEICTTRGTSNLYGDQIASQQTGPKNPRLQKTFYYYDPKEGTKCRLVNATATVAASCAGGAASSCLMTACLPGLVTSGDSIFDRTIMLLDSTFPGSSLYLSAALGATLGFAGAIWLVHSAYQGGMRPRTAAAVRGIMNGLIHQVEGDCKSIQQYKSSIQANENELVIRKEEMLAEKESNRLLAEDAYNKEKQLYDMVITGLSGELKGYLSQVFNYLESPFRSPTFEETISNTRRRGSYQLGQDVSNFIERKDFSSASKERFLRSLAPYLDETEMRGVERIVAKFPSYGPVYLPRVGPLESEYDSISFRSQSEQHKMGELEKRVRELTTRFSCFELGPDGKVKTPSVLDFSEYLPD